MNANTFNRTTNDIGLLLIRFLPAVVFVFHGSQKLFGWFGGYGIAGTAEWMTSIGIPFGTLNAVLAGSTEFFGGLLLLAGIGVRWISIPMVFTMFVAIITVHSGFDARAGGMEYPLTLAFVLAGLGFTGPGGWTLPVAVRRIRGAGPAASTTSA